MMRTGIRYLKERMKIIVLYLVFSGIFLVVFALYDIRLDAVGYAFLLALVLMLGFGGSDFCRYYFCASCADAVRAGDGRKRIKDPCDAAGIV